MTDVVTAAPMNMGTRLEWDDESKKYNVNVDDLINRIVALEAKTNYDPTEIFVREDGKVGLKGNQSLEFTEQWDLQKGVPQRGFSIFHGFGFVRGVPRNIYSTDYKQPAALQLSDYMDGNNRPDQDWTGWQIANDSEVTQFIAEESYGLDNPANVWVRQNASGINEDPSLGVYHEDRWTDWVRVSNVA